MTYTNEFNPEHAGARKGVCIWCVRRGDSKEHIFSAWLGDALELPESWESAGAMTMTRDTSYGPKTREVKTMADKFLTSRGACGDCNNGWMSQLETAVKPILSPLMNGREKFLTAEEQITLARWAAMKAVCFDGDYRNDDAGLVSQTQKEAIYLAQSVPAEFSVMVAAYDRVGHFLALRPFGKGIGSNGQPLTQWIFTAVINHVVIQVAGRTNSVLPSNLEIAPNGAHLGDRFTVWPPIPGGVSWPPPTVLGDAELGQMLSDPMPGLADHPVVIETAEMLCADEEQTCTVCDQNHASQPRVKLPYTDQN